MLLGCGRLVPVTGRQSTGNFWPCAGGGDGRRLACGCKRLGWLPLHRERWGGGLSYSHSCSCLCPARGGVSPPTRPWLAYVSGLCRCGGTARGCRHRSRAAAIARLADDPSMRQRMGEAGRRTVQQRFNWPVVARLHRQLYAELAERRLAGYEQSGLEGQHPLRGDPFRDFAPFATGCLTPETELRLAMPLSELQHRLNNLSSLDLCYGQLHASSTDLQQLLLQLHREAAPDLLPNAFAQPMACQETR